MSDLSDARLAVADEFVTDTLLSPEERETSITFSGDTDTARIHAANRSVARSLVLNENVAVEWYGLANGETVTEATSVLDADVSPVSVRCTVPVGCVSIKSTQRKRDTVSHVVATTHSTQEMPAQFMDDE